MTFSERLKELKANDTHGVFAQKLEISEALLRKYLNGSDPSLSKALQISQNTRCSLDWLADGTGSPSPTEEQINLSIFEQSMILISTLKQEKKWKLTLSQEAKLTAASYQYIKNVTKDNNVLNASETRHFIHYLYELYS